jgi:hypothetical protein
VCYRGEKDIGYSKPFRHLEFTSALEAELNLSSENSLSIDFVNALNYTGQAIMADVSIEHFNEAMQYISFGDNPDIQIPLEIVIKAVERCSLVHALYEIIATGEDVKDLAPRAIEDGGFADMYKGGPNEKATWCFRARNYGDFATSDAGKEKRYSSRARSVSLEKEGLQALTDLLIRFGGKVDLLQPDCKIYVFDGLEGRRKLLTRRVAVGPKVRKLLSCDVKTFLRCPHPTTLCSADIFDCTRYTDLHHEHSTLPDRFFLTLQRRSDNKSQFHS